MSLIEKILDRLLKKKVIINCEKDPYLHRWYLIKAPWLGVFVHRFVRSDEDRALHDHPWPFLVIPIWQGYIEHSDREKNLSEKLESSARDSYEEYWRLVAAQRRVYPILGTRLRPATFRHRVELLPERWLCEECEGFGKCYNDLGPFDCPGCGGDGHKYGALKPAWSLFIRFKRVREWGFWPKSGWVSWKQWWNDQCED